MEGGGVSEEGGGVLGEAMRPGDIAHGPTVRHHKPIEPPSAP